MLFASLTACVNLLPEYKYHLDGLKDTPQLTIYKNDCVKSLINIDKNGDFIGSNEQAIPLEECLNELLMCYPYDSQAKIEGFVKTVFEQYKRQ